MSIDSFFKQLKQIIVRGKWLLVLALSVGLLSFPPVVGGTVMVVLRIYLIIALGLLCWRGLDALIAVSTPQQEVLRLTSRTSRSRARGVW